MKMLDQLEYKYAAGGPVAAKAQALAAVQQAMAHVQNGDHNSAMQVLQRSPAAMMHPEVRAAARQLRPQQQAPMQMDEGGPVRGSSSPGSPGVTGAIKDAAAALKNYFIDAPGREADAAAQHRIDVISGQTQDDPGHASGGSIDDEFPQHISGSLIPTMLKAAANNPESAQVLHAHALALLQANLNAAHALHTSTGESGPYRQYMALANALGGGQQAMAVAPMARQAAQQAVPNQGQAAAMGPPPAPTGYAAGGSVPGEPAKGQISKMYHFMVNKMGLNPEDAANFAVNYHQTGDAGGASPQGRHSFPSQAGNVAPPPGTPPQPPMAPGPQGPPQGAAPGPPPQMPPGPQGPPMQPPQQQMPPRPPQGPPPPQQGGPSPQNPQMQLPAPMSPQALQQMQMMQAAQRGSAGRGI